MARIIGFRKSDFKAENGDDVSGYNIYFANDIPGKHGEGISTFREYFTTAKLDASEYFPVLGDNVEITYNKYQKPQAIIPLG